MESTKIRDPKYRPQIVGLPYNKDPKKVPIISDSESLKSKQDRLSTVPAPPLQSSENQPSPAELWLGLDSFGHFRFAGLGLWISG